jgi:hypothetical protein
MVVLAARGQAVTFSAMFTTPGGFSCGEMCLFGIRPGVTNIEDAQRMIAEHPLTYDLREIEHEDSRNVSYAAKDLIVTVRGRHGQPVDEVLIYFVQNDLQLPPSRLGQFTLGDALVTLKPPSRVSIGTNPMRPMNSSRNYTSWFYDSAGLLVAARLIDMRVSIQTPIRHIQLSADAGMLGQFSPVNYSARVIVTYTSEKWLGFKKMMGYVRAAVRQSHVRQVLN